MELSDTRYLVFLGQKENDGDENYGWNSFDRKFEELSKAITYCQSISHYWYWIHIVDLKQNMIVWHKTVIITDKKKDS